MIRPIVRVGAFMRVAAAAWLLPAVAVLGASALSRARAEAPGAPADTLSAVAARPVAWVRIEDAIQPATAGFLDRAIDWANDEACAALVIALDTPGGLDPSMRQIVKKILASQTPVAVFVYPPGSRAASAGVFLMMAAHVAAMAPGTNLGAAHPVSIGGGGQGSVDSTMLSKVTNDAVAYVRSLAEERGRNADWAEQAVRQSVSISADEALRRNVIDLIAANPEELLAKMDGRVVTTPSGPRELHTAGARLIRREPNFRDQVLSIVANPNVAYLLLLLGVLGIFFELSHPGTLFPGIVGGLALLLSFFGLQMLPVRAAGIALILLSVILFILEIKVTSYGALAIGGVLALLFGSLMLFDTGLGGAAALSLSVIVPSVIVVSGFFLFAVVLAVRAQRRRAVTGIEGLVGEVGEARTELAPEGRVQVHGEIWKATSRVPIAIGARVRVRRVSGMWLEVEPAPADDMHPSAPAGR